MSSTAMKIRQQILLTSLKKPSTIQLPIFNGIFYLFLLLCGVAIGIFVCFSFEFIPFKVSVTNFMTPNNNAPKQTPPFVTEKFELPPKELEDYYKVPDIKHDVEDEELLRRASIVPRINSEYTYEGVPKVAFLFLTYGRIYMAPLWEMFFKGHEGFYSIYVHSSPSYNESAYTESPVFHGRRIPSKDVRWGKVSMIEAERRLLANALLDMSNQRFVLLSESCIPLFNFSTIYSYLMNSTQNYVESFDLKGPVGSGRYNSKMAPDIKINQWRKGSQWFQMNRELALEVVSDQKYFPIFYKYCNYGCYSDEHYIPTFVNIKFPEKTSNRTLTWVDWTNGGAHPARFIRNQVTYEFLEKLRSGSSCEYNGKTTRTCHLFARKFLDNTLDRLLRFAPKIMHF